jgi:hypothetical protein
VQAILNVALPIFGVTAFSVITVSALLVLLRVS